MPVAARPLERAGEGLEEGLGWQEPERFKAFRLLGLDKLDLLNAPRLTAILQACEMLDPEAGDLAEQLSNDLLAANPGWTKERLKRWIPEMSRPPDEAAARQELLEIVKPEAERLEAKVQWHEERAELKARLAPHYLAFDLSPDAERMRRYELACHRYVFRFLDDLSKHEANSTGQSYTPAAMPLSFAQPRSPVYRQTDGPIDPSEKTELKHLIGSIRKRELAQAAERVESKRSAMAEAESQALTQSDAPVRNEPNAETAADSTQNEAKPEVTPEPCAANVTGNGRILRNEPKPAGGSVAPRGSWQPKAWDNSRRARRAREAMARATGGRELD